MAIIITSIFAIVSIIQLVLTVGKFNILDKKINKNELNVNKNDRRMCSFYTHVEKKENDIYEKIESVSNKSSLIRYDWEQEFNKKVDYVNDKLNVLLKELSFEFVPVSKEQVYRENHLRKIKK